MSSADVFSAPNIDLPAGEGGDSKWSREYEAFQRRLPELLPDYEGQFVAIHNGNVVAAGEQETDVIQAAYDMVGYVALHVAKMTQDSPQVFRIPSPRSSRKDSSAS